MYLPLPTLHFLIFILLIDLEINGGSRWVTPSNAWKDLQNLHSDFIPGRLGEIYGNWGSVKPVWVGMYKANTTHCTISLGP